MSNFKKFDMHENGTYAALKVSGKSAKQLQAFFDDVFGDMPGRVLPEDLHCTIAYSTVPCPAVQVLQSPLPITALPLCYEVFNGDSSSLVLRIKCQGADDLYMATRMLGCSYDYPEYKPHISICYDYISNNDLLNLPVPKFHIEFDEFIVNPLD